MAPGVVGREAELAEVDAFLDASAERFAVLVLEGEAGIGKTTVWQEALRRGRERGALVLACRPASAEAKLSFAALADLLATLDAAVLDLLPEPQRDALAVALLRTSADAGAPSPRAVAAGFLGALREVATAQPVVVAVDDWQWLDSASRRVLEFAMRRLDPEPVAFLCSVRSPAAGPPVDAAPGDDRRRSVALGRMSLAAIGRILSGRLGRPLPRPMLVRIATTSNGNPFYALEIARLLAERGADGHDRYSLPVPEDLRKLTAARIRRLPQKSRDAVLLASVLAAPDGRIVDLEALAAAEEAAIVTIDDSGRVRFVHPLFASAACSAIPVSRRRALHRHAAELVSDREQRARHLALGCDGVDAAVAADLDEAARLASLRGAPNAAVELSELAARLTPEADPSAQAARLLTAARHAFQSGDLKRAEELAWQLARDSPAEGLRAASLQLLAHLNGRRNNFSQAIELAAQALPAAQGDDGLRAAVELELAYSTAGRGDLRDAAEHAGGALLAAQSAGHDGMVASALACLTMTAFIGGQGLDEDRLARALALEDPLEAPLVLRPRYLDGVLRLWLGDLEGSIARLGALYDEMVAQGQEGAVPMLLLYMVQARLSQGRIAEAGDLVEQAREAAVLLDDPTASAIALGAAALVHAHDGSSELGRAEALEALGLFQHLEWRSGAIWPMWALGLIDLAADSPAAVDRVLGPLCEQLLMIGAGDPSFFVFLPDEVEALIALGELERAERYLEPFARLASALNRQWALALAERCRGMLEGARGRPRPALAAFERALAAHERTAMPFDRARTLLVAGRTHRRFKRRRQASELLGEAAATFERLGAPIWAQSAYDELARVGRRVSHRDELTETERRLAELAASGLSNQEVAERAFVSVKTVEANLTRVYRKLGVRSRVGLARALPNPGTEAVAERYSP